jgi:hypothetical protein
LQSPIDGIAGGVRDSGMSLQALQTRLLLVERRLKPSGGTAPDDLDRWPETVRDLVEQVRAGLEASERLLPDYRENLLVKRIGRADELRTQWNQSLRAAITAAKAATAAAREDGMACTSAVKQWNGAVNNATTLRKPLPEAIATARRSPGELAPARSQHNLVVAPHTKGQQARSALITMIRARLGEIVREDPLMPTWFDRVLGLMLPPRTPRSGWTPRSRSSSTA